MKSLICIVCPRGCHLQVDEEKEYAVKGNKCPRGEAYGKKELTNPTRTLTSVVKIKGAEHACCSVKTSSDISKTLIAEAMKTLENVCLQAPAYIGDIAVHDVCGTKVNWIVTKNCPVKEQRLV